MITLFTDVSHDHRAGVGAYAWWAETQEGESYRGAGIFPELIDHTNVAEVYGMVNGVYAAIKEIQPPEASKIVMETDSGVAISALAGHAYRHPHYEVLAQMLTTKLAEHGLEIEYKHAKAHPWCDRIARALMRQHRSELV